MNAQKKSDMDKTEKNCVSLYMRSHGDLKKHFDLACIQIINKVSIAYQQNKLLHNDSTPHPSICS